MATDNATSQAQGVVNLATGSFTGAGEAVQVVTGFKPRCVRLINQTDRIQHIWQEGMAATHTLNIAAAGTATDNSSSHIVPHGGPEADFRGFLVAAGAAVNGKDYVWSAWG